MGHSQKKKNIEEKLPFFYCAVVYDLGGQARVVGVKSLHSEDVCV
jgi:hypothetical protein